MSWAFAAVSGLQGRPLVILDIQTPKPLGCPSCTVFLWQSPRVGGGQGLAVTLWLSLQGHRECPEPGLPPCQVAGSITRKTTSEMCAQLLPFWE